LIDLLRQVLCAVFDGRERWHVPDEDLVPVGLERLWNVVVEAPELRGGCEKPVREDDRILRGLTGGHRSEGLRIREGIFVGGDGGIAVGLARDATCCEPSNRNSNEADKATHLDSPGSSTRRSPIQQSACQGAVSASA